MKADFEVFATQAIKLHGFKPAAHHLLLIRELAAVARGENDRLMINMPPGSAKSFYGSVLFPAWLMAQKPGTNVISASNTALLAESFSGRVMAEVTTHGKALNLNLGRTPIDFWDTTNGSTYRAVGVGGIITGLRGDYALIDDPVKSREAADSPLLREKHWDWFTGDLRSRLKPDAKIVVIMTRWHEDDLGGRLLERQAGMWRVISLPAAAEDDDPLGRKPGEYLWSDDPAYGYGADLERRYRESVADGSLRDWQALYQQNPRPKEGGLIEAEKITIAEMVPEGRTVRGWDLAATASIGSKHGDFTVGVKMLRTSDDRIIILDVVRFRAGPEDVERRILQTAQSDGRRVLIGLPQDPGQAGKAQIAYLSQRLFGFPIKASVESGDKATRAMPLASQINAGRVSMVRAPWNAAFVSELQGFSGAKFDDQVDASSRAFSMLVNNRQMKISKLLF